MKQKLIDAGEIVTTHGIRGEVKVYPWLDDPQMLCQFTRCRIGEQDYAVDACRVQKNCDLVKLRGVDTMEDAQALRGKTVQIYREDVAEDVIFASELYGVEVYCQGERIGKIADVLDYAGNAVYVVRGGPGKREYMIPAVKEFILSTDLDRNEMQVHLIEGMGTDEN